MPSVSRSSPSVKTAASATTLPPAARTTERIPSSVLPVLMTSSTRTARRAAHERNVLLVEVERLRMPRHDRLGGRRDRLAHVRLVALPQHDPRPVDGARELEHERHALGLGGHEDVVLDAFEPAGEPAHGGLDDLRVTEEIEDRDPQAGRHLEQRQLPRHALDLDPMRRRAMPP